MRSADQNMAPTYFHNNLGIRDIFLVRKMSADLRKLIFECSRAQRSSGRDERNSHSRSNKMSVRSLKLWFFIYFQIFQNKDREWRSFKSQMTCYQRKSAKKPLYSRLWFFEIISTWNQEFQHCLSTLIS